MPDEALKADADRKVLSFKPGDIVMAQGEAAKGLYILMAGSLEVFFDDVQVAEINQKGAFVGEIASLLGGQRIATVKATTEVKMLFIEKVTEYLEKNPSSALIIAQTLASRIAAMNKRFSHFEQVARNWIEAGQNAVARRDIAPIRDALKDMQEVFMREIKAG